MALYQCTYFIVPKTGNYNLFSGLNLDTFREDVFFEDHCLWNNIKQDMSKILEYLGEKFEESESWTTELKIYGDIEHNCIKVLIEKKEILSINLRIDFTLDYSLFLNKIIDFCGKFNLLIVDSDLNVLDLDFSEIKRNIETSQNFNKYKKW